MALESQWQWFKQALLSPAFDDHLPTQERILRFFDLMLEKQHVQKQNSGHRFGCPIGNQTLEMSTQDELIRARVEQFSENGSATLSACCARRKSKEVCPRP